MIFTVENIVILIFIVGLTTSIQCMILKHEWDVYYSMSDKFLVKKFFECLLCQGLYLMIIECSILVPFYGYDVLTLPFVGAGIVNFLIR